MDGPAGHIVQVGASAPSAQGHQVFKLLRGKWTSSWLYGSRLTSTDVPLLLND